MKLGLTNRRDLAERRADVGAGLKENLDDRGSTQRLGFNVLDVIHSQSHGTFIDNRHPVGHLLGGKAGVAPVHTHHGDVDVGEYIFRGAKDGEHP